MSQKKRPAQTKPKKITNKVPDWAHKIKAYREKAGNTQLDIQQAMKAKVNTMSLIETGRRQLGLPYRAPASRIPPYRRDAESITNHLAPGKSGG